MWGKIFTVTIVGLLSSSGMVHCQEESINFLDMFLLKSEYVHKVFFQLLFAHMRKADNMTIPEPMKFDNITYNHLWLFQTGESHTYDPLLFGFSASRFSIQVDNDTSRVSVHLIIPQASLTGSYDLWVDQTSIFPGVVTYRGEGAYAHTFYIVELWMNFTVSTEEDAVRPVATNMKTYLHFNRCSLWAENFRRNSIPFDEARWAEQSIIYRQKFDDPDDAWNREIMLSESAKSYFGIYWGFLKYSKEQALQNLIDLGSILDP